MITVPPDYVAWRVHADGEAGRAWVEALPALVERFVRRWGLTVDDAAALHGNLGVVVLVHRSDQPLALKVSWREDTTGGEAEALRAWRGRGAVRLAEADPEHGALLMERLDHTRTLGLIPLDEAAPIAGALIRTLAVPAPAGLRRLSDVAAGIHDTLPGRQRDLGDPVPARWLAAAVGFAGEQDWAGKQVLIHADLHYGNILATPDGSYRAVDPRPLTGVPEYSVPELIWSRAQELRTAAGIRALLETIIGAGRLDRDLARGWVVTRAVDYWLWGRQHGLTFDPEKCERIVGALLHG